MDEKIKVTLPRDILEVLKKDCGDFRVTKADGKPNFNAFINTLISNFYETFSAGEEKIYEDVRDALSAVPAFYRETAFQKIVKLIAKRSDSGEDKKETATFSFKPTKRSERAVSHIEHVLLQQESVSSFYRRMFIAYSQKLKNEREKIVCAENFAVLQRAISRSVCACIVLQNGEVLKCVSVYAVSPAKDELFNYVLLCTDQHNITLRLSNVRSVTLLAERASFPEKNAAMFRRQIVCGAQYPIYSTDDEPIRVQLSDKGKELFQKIYLYRPTPVSVDGDIYTFDCSANQILYYFERFGSRALILSPKKLGIAMRNYYYFALKKYRSLYRSD